MKLFICILTMVLVNPTAKSQILKGQKYFALGGYAENTLNSASIKFFVEKGDTTVIQRKDIVFFEHWPFDSVLTREAYIVLLKVGTKVVRNGKSTIINTWNYNPSVKDAECPTCCNSWPMCCSGYISYCQIQTVYPALSYKCVATSGHCKN